MNALKVLLATLINGTAVVIFSFHTIDWHIAGAMVLASVAGGFLGMVGARKIKADQLRLVILTIGIALSAYYFYNAYGRHR
jgi:uncharacterized membrane protein YfcA